MVNREQNEQEFRENVQGETLMNEMFESESGDIGVDSAQVEALDDLYQNIEQTEQFDEQELEANPREGISWNEA
jgi:uncharacterized protein YfkK (UPF0435 family)